MDAICLSISHLRLNKFDNDNIRTTAEAFLAPEGIFRTHFETIYSMHLESSTKPKHSFNNSTPISVRCTIKLQRFAAGDNNK